MSTVDIHLPAPSTAEWIHALSIPHEDIKRLTFRPLKWLRYATFAVCGAKGHLSATQGGETVDYENVTFDDLADRYFYHPDDRVYHLVDHTVVFKFGEPTSNILATPRWRSTFRKNIGRRDDSCVVTMEEFKLCIATHIIPRSKGKNYISFVINDRSSLYERLPFSDQEEVDIYCIENGILLCADLHIKFRLARIAFLKTPNFAMMPTDVPRVQPGPIPEHRTTLQYLVPPRGYFPVLPRDVHVDWHDDVRPPPSILLDFMYGAAVAKHWASDRLREMLEERYLAEFSSALAEVKADESEGDHEI